MNKNVVIIDDNFAIRQSLKSLLAEAAKKLNISINLYSSPNGLEGIGYVFVSKPDLVIVDTTLPKFSGREVLEYLATNRAFDKKKIIVLHEDSKNTVDIPSEYKIISKRDSNFSQKLSQAIFKELECENETLTQNKLGFKARIIDRVGHLANKLDLTQHNSSNFGLLAPIYWFFIQILLSINLAFLYIFTGKIQDDNVNQMKLDMRDYRVKAYPAIAAVLTSIFFVALQFSFFLGGGFLVFNNYRIENVAASLDSKVNVNLVNSNYGSDIKIVNGIVSLNPIVQVINPPSPELTEEKPTTQDNLDDVILPEPDSFGTGEILGVDNQSESIVTYPTSKPEIIFNEPVRYSDLIAIRENSSINNFESSFGVTPVNSSDLKNRQHSGVAITYQISPNKTDWYYFGGENRWEITTNGWESSNTIQEINEFLPLINQQISMKGKEIYFKVFLLSDGLTDVRLDKIEVERDLNLITNIEEENTTDNTANDQKDTTELSDNALIEINDESLPAPDSFGSELENIINVDSNDQTILSGTEPVVLNASFAAGEKVLAGRVDVSDENEDWFDENLNNLSVNLFFTNSTNTELAAQNKTSLIGSTNIIKISKDGTNQYLWELRETSVPGGYVTAEIELNLSDESIYSNLSKPVENSTFIVNESGVNDDVNPGDGLCDYDSVTVGAQCTLVAAVQESNALPGADVINFSIPRSDNGYRDYDNDGVPGSGDNLGGDDYWSIGLQSGDDLVITEDLTINAFTQTSNIGDDNIYGPEIVLYGNNLSGDGVFDIESNNVNIIGFSVPNWSSYAVFDVVGVDNITIQSNVIGTDPLQLTESAAVADEIIYIDESTNVTVGGLNSLNQGNVFGGYTYAAISIFGSVSPASTEIHGNRFNLSYDTNQIFTDNTFTQGIFIGGNVTANIGDTIDHRNYFTSNEESLMIYINGITNGAVTNIHNNYFGTDITGTQNRRNLTAYKVVNDFQFDSQEDGTINFGDVGRGNLIRYSDTRSLQANNVDSRATFFITPTSTNSQLNIIGNSIESHKAFLFSSFYFGFTYSQDDSNMVLRNNYLTSYSNSPDPYFGINLDGMPPTDTDGGNPVEERGRVGISLFGTDPLIQGNVIDNYFIGILASDRRNSFNQTASSNPADLSNAQIGGSSLLVSSLCNGSEQNCFTNNGSRQLDESNIGTGIMILNAPPSNLNTLYSDNDFGTGNGFNGDKNITMAWQADFEIITGTSTRTDENIFSNINFTIPEDRDFINAYDMLLSRSLSYYENDCTNGVTDCPINVDGESGKTGTYSADLGSGPEDFDIPFSYAVEYYIDNTGTKIDKSLYQNIDLPHFALVQPFSFDGRATLAQVNDYGEPWTTNPLTGNDIPNLDFTADQVAQVQFVDANPVYDSTNNEWVIIVDTELEEDNVSLSGIDDGNGAYSGGGINGPDGPSNGRTSIQEAIFVSNNFSEDIKIKFNIFSNFPADSNKISDPVLSLGTPLTITDGIIIDGDSQAEYTGNDTQVFNLETDRDFTGPNNDFVFGSNIGAEVRLFNYNSGTIFDIQASTEINSFAASNPFSNTVPIFRVRNTSEDVIFNRFSCGASLGECINVESNFTGTFTLNENLHQDGNSFDPTYRLLLNYEAPNSTLNVTNSVFHNSSHPYIHIAAAVNDVNIVNNFFNNGPFAFNRSAMIEVEGDANVTIEDSRFLQAQDLGAIRIVSPGARVELINTEFDNEYGGLPIDIVGGIEDVNGNTANDIDDLDSGPNGLMNTPEITSIEFLYDGYFRINGIIDGNPAEAPFSADLCIADSVISAGLSQCETHLIRIENITDVNNDGDYVWSYIYNLPGLLQTSEVEFNAYATNSNNQSSEFIPVNFITNAANSDYINAVYDLVAVYPSQNQILEDSTPLIDFNAYQSGDFVYPDIAKYEIYIDGNLVNEITTNLSLTEYLVTTPLSDGLHTYSVRVYAEPTPGNFTLLDDTGEITFTVAEPILPTPPDPEPIAEPEPTDPPEIVPTPLDSEPIKEPEPTDPPENESNQDEIQENESDDSQSQIVQNESGENDDTENLVVNYPKDVNIDNQTPSFSWNIIEGFDYELIIYTDKGVEIFRGNPGNTGEFKIPEELSNGSYTWEIIGVRENETISSGLTDFSINEFNLDLPEDIAFSDIQEEIVAENDQSREENLTNEIIPAITPALASVIIIVSAVLTTSLISSGNTIQILGVFIGWIIRKKKKYWGIVFDGADSKPVPFANIRLYEDKNGERKFKYQSVTDLNGRYGFFIDQPGKYIIEVAANGFSKIEEQINVNDDLEVIEDFEISRLKSQSKKFNLLSNLKYNRKELLDNSRIVISLLMLLGLIYTTYATLVSPIVANVIMLIIYMLFILTSLILYIKDSKTKVNGQIINESGVGLDKVSVRIYNNKQQLDIALTNKKGNLKLNLSPNSYQVVAKKDGYSTNKLGTNSGDIESESEPTTFGQTQGESVISDDDFIDVKVNEKGYLDKAISMYKS